MGVNDITITHHGNSLLVQTSGLFTVCINNSMKITKTTSTDKLAEALTTTVNIFNLAFFITLIYLAGEFVLMGFIN